MTLTNCHLLSNRVSSHLGSGGGIYSEGGTLTIRDTSLIANVAQGYATASSAGSGEGSGLCYAGSAPALLTNCTFYKNEASGSQYPGSTPSIDSGGAIYTSGPLVALSCTVAGNLTIAHGASGGIASFASAPVEIGSTIVAGNTNADGNRDVIGAFRSDGYNLIGTLGSSTGFTNSGYLEQYGSDAAPVDALLGDLIFSGGLGPTLSPRYGSPALDRGHNFNLPYDQRGFPRTRHLASVPVTPGLGPTDVGAVEVQSLFVKADFNRDGTSDILWQNLQTGRRDIWTIRNASLYQVASLGPVATEWHNAAVGDMNGDGQEDILWQNIRTGERDIWLMQGVTLKQVVHLPKVDLAWEIAGVGDFDADGQNDIVWQNLTTGERDLWLMSGTNLRQVVHLPLVGTEWHIAAAGDMDGDSFSDLVWENTQTGQRGVWLLRNAALASTYFLPDVDLAWQIVGTGDFDNDGHTDLLWQNTQTGQRGIWLLNGAIDESYEPVFLPTVTLEWGIANH